MPYIIFNERRLQHESTRKHLQVYVNDGLRVLIDFERFLAGVHQLRSLCDCVEILCLCVTEQLNF
jgi:hypothetical protein